MPMSGVLTNSRYPAQKDKVFEDMPPTLPVEPTGVRVLHGGAFFSRPSDVRSADRVEAQPGTRINYDGFRPARTYH